MENTDDKRLRAAKKYIKVTYPDGQSICYKSVTLTYLEFLRRLTNEQLSSIDLELCHLPLISRTVYPAYKDYMKEIGRGWYVNTQSDSHTRYLQLTSINQKLGLGLVVEIGEDLQPSNVKGFSKGKKAKDNLLVQFPDGTYIGEETPKATYIATLRRIGIAKLQQKGVEVMGKPLLTFSKLHNQQEELKEEKLWLTIPNTTKDKYKALMSVSLIMRAGLSLTIL